MPLFMAHALYYPGKCPVRLCDHRCPGTRCAWPLLNSSGVSGFSLLRALSISTRIASLSMNQTSILVVAVNHLVRTSRGAGPRRCAKSRLSSTRCLTPPSSSCRLSSREIIGEQAVHVLLQGADGLHQRRPRSWCRCSSPRRWPSSGCPGVRLALDELIERADAGIFTTQ